MSSSLRLGKFIYEVGVLLARACESFVAEALVDSSQSIENLITTSQCNKARLLHYFSPTDKPDVAAPAEEKEIDDGEWHVDTVSFLFVTSWLNPMIRLLLSDLCGIHLVRHCP